MIMLSRQPAARKQILAALEASSASLRALEVAAALSTERQGADTEEREHLDRAIELLRRSISELRLAERAELRPGATGFVMAVRHRSRHKLPTEPPSAA